MMVIRMNTLFVFIHMTLKQTCFENLGNTLSLQMCSRFQTLLFVCLQLIALDNRRYCFTSGHSLYYFTNDVVNIDISN